MMPANWTAVLTTIGLAVIVKTVIMDLHNEKEDLKAGAKSLTTAAVYLLAFGVLIALLISLLLVLWKLLASAWS